MVLTRVVCALIRLLPDLLHEFCSPVHTGARAISLVIGDCFARFKSEIASFTGEVSMMKSCLKLYGPRIADALSALEAMVEEIREDASMSRIVTAIDPSIDLMTEQMIKDGAQTLGEYDFAIEWRSPPPPRSLRKLVRKLDTILVPTGCRYTITTCEL